MKKLAAFAIGAAMSIGAYAAPAPNLPDGPIFLKFSGQEQIAVGGGSTYAGTNEINWGVFTISTMNPGSVAEPNDLITESGFPFFVNGNGGQITGMFYGIEQGAPSATNPFPAKSGFLDLYWRDLSTMSATSVSGINPGIRCGFSCANGFTQGDFLVRLFFDTGMDPGNPINTIVGTTVPTSNASFTGQANSYASVDKSAGGLWADELDSNWFNTYLGQRDLRFKNSYNSNTTWNGASQNGLGAVLGASIDDPGQAFAVPEPGALSLMGLAMVGMGAVLRRREKKAA